MGETALHRACSTLNANMISLLLRNGAEISPEDVQGKTPFSFITPSHWDRRFKPCLMAMVKEFSALHFEEKFVLPKDMSLIRKWPFYWETFAECTAELNLMKKTKFYGDYNYHCVLRMDLNELKRLARNKELVQNFLSKLPELTHYETDLQKKLVEAIRLRDDLVAVEIRLKQVFGDYLPDVVIRLLAEYLELKDLPLE